MELESSSARASGSAAAADAFAAAFDPPVPRALTGPAMPGTRAVTVQQDTGWWAAPSAVFCHVRSVTHPAVRVVEPAVSCGPR